VKTYKRENVGSDVDVAALKDAIEAEEKISPAIVGISHDMESLMLSCTFNLQLKPAEERVCEAIIDEHVGGR